MPHLPVAEAALLVSLMTREVKATQVVVELPAPT